MTSAPPRASQTAAWPAELPPPTTATRAAPQQLRLGRPGGVEDARAFVVGRGPRPAAGGTARRWPARPRARRSRGPPRGRTTWRPVARLQRQRAVRRCQAARRTCAPELTARLVSSVPLIPAGKPEVVLDPARRCPPGRRARCSRRRACSGPPTRRRPRRRGLPGHRRRRAGRPPRAARARGRCRARASTSPVDGALQLGAARQPHERQARRRASDRSASSRRSPRERQPVGAREVEHLHRLRGRARPTISIADPFDRLQRLRRAMNVDSTRSLSGPSSNEQRPQRVAVDGDVAAAARHDRR